MSQKHITPNFREAIAAIDSITSIPFYIQGDSSTGAIKISGSVTITAPTTIVSGQTTVTTAGTRVQLSTNTCQSLTLRSLPTNSGLIYVGGSTVSSSTGDILDLGDRVAYDLSNTNKIYIDAQVSGDGVSWSAIN